MRTNNNLWSTVVVLCAMTLLFFCPGILSFSVTTSVRNLNRFNSHHPHHDGSRSHLNLEHHPLFPSSSERIPFSYSYPYPHTVLEATSRSSRGRSLLDDFTTVDGDTINPYSVLNISRSATRREVRQAYRCLSKQYHPDRVKFLDDDSAGECIDPNQLRMKWERIQLANEILSNKRLRLKYDRIDAIHQAIADPSLAMCQVIDALGWCVMKVGRGIFTLGEMAVGHVGRKMEEAEVAVVAATVFPSSYSYSYSFPSLLAPSPVLVPALAFATTSPGTDARSTTLSPQSHTFSFHTMDDANTGAPPRTGRRRSLEGAGAGSGAGSGSGSGRRHRHRNHHRLPNCINPLRSSRARAILPPSMRLTRWQTSSTSTSLGYSRDNDDSFLLEDFTTADGEVINPYRVLKVGRDAKRAEIRQSYRALSKKYHPDGVRFREVMPGKCNNLDDVRDEWERVKLSYEILSDRKMRLKYDRHSAIHDPLGAMGRATLSTMGWAVMETGRGIFNIGGMAVKHMANITNDPKDANFEK